MHAETFRLSSSTGAESVAGKIIFHPWPVRNLKMIDEIKREFTRWFREITRRGFQPLMRGGGEEGEIS